MIYLIHFNLLNNARYAKIRYYSCDNFFSTKRKLDQIIDYAYIDDKSTINYIREFFLLNFHHTLDGKNSLSIYRKRLKHLPIMHSCTYNNLNLIISIIIIFPFISVKFWLSFLYRCSIKIIVYKMGIC